MLTRDFVLTLGILALSSTLATAMTITNRDAGDHQVTISAGDKEVEHTIASGATVEDACEGGCKVQLSGSEDVVEANADDELEIAEGKLSPAE